MCWSSWGLAALADDAPVSSVLTEGCRVFTLAVPEHHVVGVEQLSGRWSISSMDISATALTRMPRRGDVVVWRAFEQDEPINWFLSGGPSRVVAIQAGDRPDSRAFFCLRDVELDKYAPGRDAWPYRMKVSDRMLPRSREWDLLATWRLHPPCPRCGGTARAIIVGFRETSMDDRDDLVFAGCVLTGDPADYECSACGLEFSLPPVRRAA